jgi:hypothetical protein
VKRIKARPTPFASMHRDESRGGVAVNVLSWWAFFCMVRLCPWMIFRVFGRPNSPVGSVFTVGTCLLGP